jgi:hypothetical protein
MKLAMLWDLSSQRLLMANRRNYVGCQKRSKIITAVIDFFIALPGKIGDAISGLFSG